MIIHRLQPEIYTYDGVLALYPSIVQWSATLYTYMYMNEDFFFDSAGISYDVT